MGIDCSLCTWPSITQFDDLTWMGLADIDPLESLDRSVDNDSQFTQSSFTNQEERNTDPPTPKVSVDTTSAEVPVQNDDFYRLTSCESLAAARWESINAVDLASVLDSFPSSIDTSTQDEEDVYDLYGESIILQAEPQLAGDVDVFMSDAMAEVPDVNNNITLSEDESARDVATAMSSDQTSLSCIQDVKCDANVVDDQSPPSVNNGGAICGHILQVSAENSVLRRPACSTQHLDHIDRSGCGSRVNVVQPAGFYGFHPMKVHGYVDSGQGVLNIRPSMAMPQHDCTQPSMVVSWSQPHSGFPNPQLFSGEQMVQVQQTPIGSYPAIIDQQLKMADAARVSSELKRNRAQASRARRLAASQRRAKKYPLQKLIRMSSSPASSRDKVDQVDQNGKAASVAPHRQLQPASQDQLSAPVHQPHPTAILPVAQSNQLASCHEPLTPANALQVTPYHRHQHQSLDSQFQVAFHGQDSLVSLKGTKTLQINHDKQNIHTLSTLPSLATSHMSNANESLDAAVLNQLQSITNKMDVGSRLCIRDALYRLAQSAKVRQNRPENVSGLAVNASHPEVLETNTNSIDRWIVNMLFCKQSSPFDENSQSLFSQTPSHTTDSNNTSTIMQQWSSCGSFLNVQDQPLHVVTGL